MCIFGYLPPHLEGIGVHHIFGTRFLVLQCVSYTGEITAELPIPCHPWPHRAHAPSYGRGTSRSFSTWESDDLWNWDSQHRGQEYRHIPCFEGAIPDQYEQLLLLQEYDTRNGNDGHCKGCCRNQHPYHQWRRSQKKRLRPKPLSICEKLFHPGIS